MKGQDNMEFIELTNSEYKRILRRVALVTPITESLKIVGVFVLAGIVVGVMRETVTLVSVTLTTLLFLMLRPGVVFLGVLSMLFSYYPRSRKIFISKVKGLDSPQYEQLLSEYSNARRVNIYYDRGKRLLGSDVIYVTEHFLFIPGLFLMSREEISEISILGRRVSHEPTTTFLFSLKDQSEQKLILYYRYKDCPETTEQIMAWFWQCDPDESDLQERTKVFVKESEEKWKKAERAKWQNQLEKEQRQKEERKQERREK